MPYYNRKKLRLPNYDYNSPGCYFITICTKERRCILSHISVGADVLGGPENSLSAYGKIAEKTLLEMEGTYPWLTIDNYVIMPNHVHFLVRITEEGASRTPTPTTDKEEGSSRTPTPTTARIPMLVSTWKRRIGHEIGSNIWQRGYYEHVIRDDADFQTIWKYIQENPAKWTQDRYFMDL